MSIKLKAIALALSSIAIIGVSAQSQAAPASFVVNPNAIPGTTGKAPFTADFIAGTSSELLHNSAPGSSSNVTTGTGFLQLTGFSLNSNAIFGNVSGLGSTYGAYILFTLSATGNFAPGTSQALTQLDFKLFADPGLNTTFQQATVSGNTGTEASESGTADDLLLAFGSVLPGGVAGVDSNGGVFVNATQSFALCSGVGTAKMGATNVPGVGPSSVPGAPACTSAIGTNYFISPVPFFQVAFDEFNNTAQGVTQSTNGSLVAIRSATGGLDFNANAVPEPDTIALFGIAAVAAGLSFRRRKAA